MISLSGLERLENGVLWFHLRPLSSQALFSPTPMSNASIPDTLWSVVSSLSPPPFVNVYPDHNQLSGTVPNTASARSAARKLCGRYGYTTIS
jgi:hypothetical protein